MLESSVALAPDSMHWVHAMIDGQAQPMQFRVRHAIGGGSSDAPYLIGVEFVVVNVETQAFINRYCDAPGAAETV